jgi:hypothetical protein
MASVTAFGQSNASTAGSASSSAASQVGEVMLASNAAVTAQLQNSLDVKKARVGDEVLLRTTRAVKQNGKTVIEKGATLVGRVTEVSRKAKGTAGSSISAVFDRLRQNGSEMPVTAFITSVVQTSANASGTSDDAWASTAASSNSSAGASTGGGGLLGGVTSTVGGVANTATGALGGVTGTAGSATGGVTRVVSGPLRGLSVSQSTSASANGSSTLSMPGRDLKLEKGTTFNLSVSSSTSVERN